MHGFALGRMHGFALGRMHDFALGRMPALALCVLVLAAPGVAQSVDKSGVRPSAVSLPSGPGSIQGLGDLFEPDLSTGVAGYSIALKVPTATAGIEPSLGLSYNGGNGNGPLGYGWDIDLPFVQRDTARGLPRYVDEANGLDDDGDGEIDELDELDEFVSDTADLLVRQADGFYFARTEGEFVRYRRVGDYWEGILPDGTLLEFGVTAEARLVDDQGRVFKWLLERETDTRSLILYSHAAFPGENNLNQKYLAKIEWGKGFSPWTHSHFVAFEYEVRPDWFEVAESGFLVRTGMRLKTINVATQGPSFMEGHLEGDFNGDGIPDFLNNTYRLTYEIDPFASLLTTFTTVGADGSSTLPPLSMTYTACTFAESTSVADDVIGTTNSPVHLMNKDWVDLSDLNGDGLPDLLRTDPLGGPHLGYLNRGEIATSEGTAIDWGPELIIGGDPQAVGVSLQDSGSTVSQLADMNADGLADLVYKAGTDVYFFAAQPQIEGLSWGPRQLMNPDTSRSAPAFPFEAENVLSGDFNGDRRMDIIQSIDSGALAYYRIWFNIEGREYSTPFTYAPATGFRLSDQGVNVIDINGDGLSDIAQLRPAGIDFSPGLGYGNFAARRFVPLPDYTLSVEEMNKAGFEDLNADGLDDLVIENAGAGRLWFWLNKGNDSFEPRREITGLPPARGTGLSIRWADMNGNGTTDLVYTGASPRLTTIDIGRVGGCVSAPNLLASINNGIGRTMAIEYTFSTLLQVRDAMAGNPWPDPMPFPVGVVTKLTVDDSLGGLYVTDFDYHNGYYDGARREFAGFANAEIAVIGDATAPTQVTAFTLDVGREVLAMRGNIVRETISQEDGEVFTDTLTSYAPRILMTGENGTPITFAPESGEVTNVLERGTGEPKTIESEFEFDDFGNLIELREYGVVEGLDKTASNDERITTTEMALDAEFWLVNYPSRIEVKDFFGQSVTRQEIYYDDPTFAADNLGVVSFGNPTLVREWTDPSDPMAFVATERTQYDAFGNASVFLDALAVAPGGVVEDAAGHYRTVDYDEDFASYPVAEIIQLEDGKPDLTFASIYDVGHDALTSSTNPSDNETTIGYDPFGRITRIVRPGHTDAFPSETYSYAMGEPFEGGVINYVETHLLDTPPGTAGSQQRDHYYVSRTYIDGLGRELMVKREAEPDPVTGNPRVSVTGGGTFNGRQEVSFDIDAYFSTLPDTDLDAQLAYENVEALGWTGAFQFDGALRSLGLDEAPGTLFEYDALLRNTLVVDATGCSIVREYEPLLTRVHDELDTDPNSPFVGTPTTQIQDGLGRLVEVVETGRLNADGSPSTDLQGWSTRYAYREDGPLTRLKDAHNNEKWFEYDGLGRTLSLNDFNRGELRVAYDAAGNIIEKIDAKGQNSRFTYDGANRLLTEDYHDEDEDFSAGRTFVPGLPMTETNRPDVAYTYDKPAEEVAFGTGSVGTAENTAGRLAHVSDLAGEEHISYTIQGSSRWKVKRIPDPVTGQLASFKTETVRDDLGRLSEVIFPDGDRVRYEYNPASFLERIHGGATANGGGEPHVISAIDYAPTGQRVHTQYGNGVATDHTYDILGRTASSASAHGASIGDPLLAYRYTYDNVSNITRIDDERPDTRGPGDPRRNTQIFEYDDLYRLIGARYSFSLPGQDERDDGQIAYRYDRIGNMLSKVSTIDHRVNGRSVTNLGTLSYGGGLSPFNRLGRTTSDPGPHALTEIDDGDIPRSIDYDANGNMTRIDDLASTWDFKDRLVAVETNDTRAEYAYDYDDRRIVKALFAKRDGITAPTPTETVQYIDPHFEVRAFDQPTKYVFDGDTRVARITGTLDPTTERTQKLRLLAGWNLFSLAVDAADAVAQLGIGDDPNIHAAFRWDDVAGQFIPVAPADSLPPGCVLWLNAVSDASLSIHGFYTDPAPGSVMQKDGFVAFASLEAYAPAVVLPSETERAWVHDAVAQTWRTQFQGARAFLSDLPHFVGADRPLFVDLPAPALVAPPDPSRRIYYYHQDHLGSSNILADANGEVVDESTFYPFGQLRHRADSSADRGALPNAYLFSQKELDGESGLQNFESRYLTASLGRFNRVDPLTTDLPEVAMLDPQLQNGYAAFRNSPVVFRDPTGEIATNTTTKNKNKTNSQTNTKKKLKNKKKRMKNKKRSRSDNNRPNGRDTDSTESRDTNDGPSDSAPNPTPSAKPNAKPKTVSNSASSSTSRASAGNTDSTANSLGSLNLGDNSLATVRVNTGGSGQGAPNLGAQAFATGNRVAFANPSPSLNTAAHEATHVVQQRAGRVRPTLSVNGTSVNDSAGLEREADNIGRRLNQ
jgi:RHS repeat-associated protein